MPINFITKVVQIPNSYLYEKKIQGTLQHISLLNKNSSCRVKVQCEYCGDVNEVSYCDLKYRDYYRCHKCAMRKLKGISNSKNIGNTPWNKGMENFLSEKSKNSMIEKLTGRAVWNKGNKGFQVAWNKGKVEIWTEEQLENNRRKNTYSLEDYQYKYPLFCKVEDLKEDLQTGEILGRCKNHKCPNSKKNDGWFVLTKSQIHGRLSGIYYGNDGCFFYCSEKCKQECRLFGKSAAQLIKEDQIAAGYILEEYYTSKEYNVWREEVLKRANYKCEYCGEKAIHCHHIKPQKLEPFFALDPDWGIATCRECHYKFGHPAGTECSTGTLANIVCRDKYIKGDK